MYVRFHYIFKLNRTGYGILRCWADSMRRVLKSNQLISSLSKVSFMVHIVSNNGILISLEINTQSRYASLQHRFEQFFGDCELLLRVSITFVRHCVTSSRHNQERNEFTVDLRVRCCSHQIGKKHAFKVSQSWLFLFKKGDTD